MSKLFLIKHSLPEINPDIPSQQWQLSNEGIARCAWLAKEMKHHEVQRIISSHEPKARQTAEEIAKHLGLQNTAHEQLHENDRTGFPFLPKEEFEQKILDFFIHPDDIIMGKESAKQAQQRFANAVDQIIASSTLTTAVVAHGTVNSLFVKLHNEIDVMKLWRGLGLPCYLVLRLPHFGWDGNICNYSDL